MIVHSHVQNFVMCIVGKMAQEVLWCHSHLVWLDFEGSISTCACFHSEKFIVTCSCHLVVVVVVCRNDDVREER